MSKSVRRFWSILDWVRRFNNVSTLGGGSTDCVCFEDSCVINCSKALGCALSAEKFAQKCVTPYRALQSWESEL